MYIFGDFAYFILMISVSPQLTIGHSGDEERKEMRKEIEELKFQLVLAQQDLQNEQETSVPLLKEVEMQKIRIDKLEEENRRMSKERDRGDSQLSPVHSPSASDRSDADEVDDDVMPRLNKAASDPLRESDLSALSKREEFKKLLRTQSGRKRHVRSVSFTSSSFSSLDRMGATPAGSGDDDSLGLRSQELIDVWKCKKVELLNEQIERLKAEMKKKEGKLLEYKVYAACSCLDGMVGSWWLSCSLWTSWNGRKCRFKLV